jgi:hypothetical protein
MARLEPYFPKSHGRPLDHEVLAAHCLLDRDGLRTVCVGDVNQLGRGENLINAVVRPD